MKRPAVLLIAIGIVILVGLAVLLRPTAPPAAVPPSPVPATAASAAPRTPAGPPVHSFDIVVSHGRRVSGPELIQVHVGDNVALHVTSDQADELHLHGYDLHLRLRPGEPGALAFQAVHSGHFDYELHHAQLELGALEVLPQ